MEKTGKVSYECNPMVTASAIAVPVVVSRCIEPFEIQIEGVASMDEPYSYARIPEDETHRQAKSESDMIAFRTVLGHADGEQIVESEYTAVSKSNHVGSVISNSVGHKIQTGNDPSTVHDLTAKVPAPVFAEFTTRPTVESTSFRRQNYVVSEYDTSEYKIQEYKSIYES